MCSCLVIWADLSTSVNTYSLCLYKIIDHNENDVLKNACLLTLVWPRQPSACSCRLPHRVTRHTHAMITSPLRHDHLAWPNHCQDQRNGFESKCSRSSAHSLRLPGRPSSLLAEGSARTGHQLAQEWSFASAGAGLKGKLSNLSTRGSGTFENLCAGRHRPEGELLGLSHIVSQRLFEHQFPSLIAQL